VKAEIRKTLVCFAVGEEARGFRNIVGERKDIRLLLTGMGRRNAESAIRAVLAKERPQQVLSCGFAGGLRPELAAGTVLFEGAAGVGLEEALLAAGARAGRFHCAERVVTTAEEKRALWQATGAEAVEMESQVVHTVCREAQIPCVTVRVILDAAQQDLPLDFNLLMTSDFRMSYLRLAGALVKSPGRIGALRRFRKEVQAAARELARVLAAVTGR
jgi:adenosylhomocysteine nucleosidase